MHYRNDRNTITLHFGKHNSLWSLDRQSIMALSVTFIMEINIILAECNNAIFSYFNMKTGLNLRIKLLIFYRLYNCCIKLAIWTSKKKYFQNRNEMKCYLFSFSQVCDTKQILVSERDGETSLEYSVPLKSFEFKFQRAQQSQKLVVILRLLQVSILFSNFLQH